MTSPLRRKHPITVPNTQGRKPARAVSRLAAAIAAAGLLAALAVPLTARATETSVQLASYSTGTNGSKLKWLPRQTEGSAVRQAAAQEVIGPGLTAPQNEPAIVAAPAKAPAGLPSVLGDGPAKIGPLVPSPKPEVVPPMLTAPQPSQVPSTEVAVGPTRTPCPDPSELPTISQKRIIDAVPPSPGEFPQTCPMSSQSFQQRCFSPLTFTWKASALCHKPVYFEDVQLERYGHTWIAPLQPVVSAGHFFLAVPALPYFMGLYPPNECMYTLGYYRPGSCAPWMLDPLPLSVRAALAEGAVVTGAALVIP